MIMKSFNGEVLGEFWSFSKREEVLRFGELTTS